MVILKERTGNREGFDMLDFLLEHHLLIFESSWIIALLTLMIATMISPGKTGPCQNAVLAFGVVFGASAGDCILFTIWRKSAGQKMEPPPADDPGIFGFR